LQVRYFISTKYKDVIDAKCLQERVLDWAEKFGRALGLQVLEVTADSEAAESAAVDAADIICTTPEKFGEPKRSKLVSPVCMGGPKGWGCLVLCKTQ